MPTYNILMMGASYGALLAIKLLFGGHKITMVCLPNEVEAFNSDGAHVRMPIRGRATPVDLDSRKLPGSLRAAGTGDVNAKDYDLAVLAMQEPQYRSPGVRELLDALARAQVPCMSIMNMPPLPYLARIPGLNVDALRSCFTDATVWDNFTPGKITLAARSRRIPSADPRGGVISVVLRIHSTHAIDGSPAAVVHIDGLWLGNLPIPHSLAERRIQSAMPQLVPLIQRALSLQLGARRATTVMPEVQDTARLIAQGEPFPLAFKWERLLCGSEDIRVEDGALTITFVPPTPADVRPR